MTILKAPVLLWLILLAPLSQGESGTDELITYLKKNKFSSGYKSESMACEEALGLSERAWVQQEPPTDKVMDLNSQVTRLHLLVDALFVNKKRLTLVESKDLVGHLHKLMANRTKILPYSREILAIAYKLSFAIDPSPDFFKSKSFTGILVFFEKSLVMAELDEADRLLGSALAARAGELLASQLPFKHVDQGATLSLALWFFDLSKTHAAKTKNYSFALKGLSNFLLAAIKSYSMISPDQKAPYVIGIERLFNRLLLILPNSQVKLLRDLGDLENVKFFPALFEELKTSA